MPTTSHRVGRFTESVIRRMTRVAMEHGAVNLSQGFPDFDPPEALRTALERAAPEAVAAEGDHGCSGHSQAAPRTPDESPCIAGRMSVSNWSENTSGAIAAGRRS